MKLPRLYTNQGIRQNQIFEYDFLFDTSSIRGIARLPEHEWIEFLHLWKKYNLNTGWIPWVIGELIGTCLDWKDKPLDHDSLLHFQKAVERFDQLAQEDILPDMDYLYCKDIYEMAQVPIPESREDIRRDLIEKSRWGLNAFKKLKDVSKVTTESHEDGKILEIYFEPEGEKYNYSQYVPKDFREAFEHNLKIFEKKTNLNKKSSKTDLFESIWKVYFPLWFRHTIKRLNVPQEVLSRLEKSLDLANATHTSLHTFIFEGWYLAKAAYRQGGRKNKNKTENDSRDIHIASYLCIASYLISDDEGLRDMVRPLLSPQRTMPLADLMSNLVEDI